LQPDGFTAYLIAELQRYAQAGVFNGGGKRNGPALLVCLSLHEHRRVSLADLKLTRKRLGLHGTLCCLDVDGNVLGDCSAGRPASGEPAPADLALTAQALTALRHHMTAQCAGRVLIGGKRLGYTGRMPGLVEEALLALAAGQPLYLAAGFGGVTLDMAAWVDARCADHCPRHADDPQPGAGTRDGLAQWAELIAGAGWSRLANGLDAEENLRLATTHRPAEIAALVGLGLGRLGLRAG
jgi:hypothetical protein